MAKRRSRLNSMTFAIGSCPLTKNRTAPEAARQIVITRTANSRYIEPERLKLAIFILRLRKAIQRTIERNVAEYTAARPMKT